MDWLSIIRAIAPKAKPSIAQATANLLPQMLAEFDISTADRQAHFLAQLVHESDGLATTLEYASGAAYEGRKDLGNTKPGDGKRYKGRGLIQLTGRANYTEASKKLGVDFIGSPELAGQFPHALRIAGWFWAKKNLNRFADQDDIVEITRRINGGQNGLADRKNYLTRAKRALAANPAELPTAKPKTMTTSKTGNASILAGAGGAIATGKVVVDVAKEAAETASDAATLATSLGPWVLLGVVIIAAAGFIWWDRRKKMQEHGI